MQKQGYVGIEVLNGGYVVDVCPRVISEEGTRTIVTSQAKAIKLVREALDKFDGKDQATPEA